MRRLCLLMICLASIGACRRERLESKRSQPAVVVVEADEEENESLPREREPNDTRQQSHVLKSGQPTVGSLRAGDAGTADVDWYRVEMAAGAVLRTEVGALAGGDLVLDAFSADGSRLVTVDNNGVGGGEQIVNLSGARGDIYIRVSFKPIVGAGRSAVEPASSDSSDYRITARVRDRDPGEEVEPNGSAEVATPLALGEDVSGYCGWRGDEDWYRVANLPPEQLLRLELDGVDDVAPILSVRDLEGRVIQQRKGTPGHSVMLTNLRVPDDSEAAIVTVECGDAYNVESRYSLRASAVVEVGSEVEPNDVTSRATPVVPGDSISGIVASSGDKDIYRIQTDHTRLLAISVIPPPRLDVTLAMVSKRGRNLVKVNEKAAGRPESLVVVVQPPAWLRVAAAGNTSIENPRPYRLDIRSLGTAEGVEREPNDQSQSATEWSADRLTMTGFVDRAGDVDYYKIQADGSSGSSLQVQLDPGSARKPELALLAGSRVVQRRTPGSAGETVSLQAALKPGTEYFLRVRAQVQGEPTEPYRLTRRAAVRPLLPIQ